ncbi:MAG TPA: response regulator [Nitrospiraceae bacterium]|jgi:two-component system chemotaxis response regulator CheY|nr:response regulator [Nitrospiraceae bacterium]
MPHETAQAPELEAMAETILIVDDCATTRRLLSVYLRQEGYDLVHAVNGLDALEKLALRSVDLVITDMNMPQMDGVALARALKQDPVFKWIPIVMLTTEGEERERQHGLEAGAAAYLIKPVTQEQLAQEVRRTLTSGRN